MPRYSACLCGGQAASTVQMPCEKMNRHWKIQNNGTVTIRGITVSMLNSNFPIKRKSWTSKGEVRPGESTDVGVDFNAPQRPGGYAASFCLKAWPNDEDLGPILHVPFEVVMMSPAPIVVTPNTGSRTLLTPHLKPFEQPSYWGHQRRPWVHERTPRGCGTFMENVDSKQMKYNESSQRFREHRSENNRDQWRVHR